jgi:hypothetical protein
VPDPEQVVDLVVMAAELAPGGSAAHAIECQGCRNVVLEDVTLYASNCFGFLETGCEATTYRRCHYDRRPPETDLVVREPPIRSGNADAFHSKHAIVGPRYLDCVARFMGDGVELVAFDGRRLPDASVKEVRPSEAITPDEAAWLRVQAMNENLRTNAGGAVSKGYDVVLDCEADLPRGSVIASTRRMGNGFENCAFPCILCTSTEDLTLADNRFPTEPAAQATWGSHLVPAAERGKPVVTVECTPAR